MKMVVIIPTYNEVGNIKTLVEALQVQFRGLRDHDMHLLIVDDNSPDHTADRVKEMQVSMTNLHLLEGEKRGLGVAYIRGMKYALNELGAEVVFEMDADFSHEPRDLPRLLVNLEQGADFVIGSRYVPGGTIPKEWGWWRKLNSTFGNIVARYLAGIYRVHDCTAGFRCIRGSLLRSIDLDKLKVNGYAFQVALLHAAVVKGAKVVEVPVDFIDRKHGESKLGIDDIVEFIISAWWIRFQAAKTFVKFAIVGSSGVVVNIGVFTLLLNLGVNRYVASPLAIEASIIINFLLNNAWTFRWRRNSDRRSIKGLKFNLVSVIALSISYTTFVVMSLLFPHVEPQVHQLIGIVPATLVNYFLNSYWTFREMADPATNPIRPDRAQAGKEPLT